MYVQVLQQEREGGERKNGQANTKPKAELADM